MQLIVLAAGMGRRLDPLTRRTPKCLVEVNGTPIILNALNALSQSPLSRIVVVIGHLGEQVKAALGSAYNGIPIEYVDNPIYDKTNNIYSLWLARDYFDSDTILMESDIYFEPELISQLCSGPIDNVALVDQFRAHMDGTVVAINDSMEISAMIPSSAQDEDFDYTDKYKTVNIYSFSAEYLRGVFLPALQDYIRDHGQDRFYELVIAALIARGTAKLGAALVSDAKWVEIDDFVDLERAEDLFSEPDQLFEKVRGLYGGFWRYGFVDYSYIYNHYFPTPSLLAELKLNMTQVLCGYPSGLKEILTYLENWVGIDADKLAIGNGSSEIIAALKRTVLKRMTISVPTFNEYTAGLSEDKVNLHYSEANDFALDVTGFINSVEQSDSNMAVLVSPDLPSGHLLQPNELHQLCTEMAHLDVIVLDESFIEFSFDEASNSFLSELDQYRNLLIVRSLSKDLGTPGLRLGYAASSNRELIQTLRRELPIWNINGLAEYFLAILPKYRQEFRDACRKVMADRAYFYDRLSTIPEIRVFKSAANYLLVKLPPQCQSDVFTKHLFVSGNILVKDCSNKMGLQSKSWLRLAVHGRQQTEDFIRKFRASLSELTASA